MWTIGILVGGVLGVAGVDTDGEVEERSGILRALDPRILLRPHRLPLHRLPHRLPLLRLPLLNPLEPINQTLQS